MDNQAESERQLIDEILTQTIEDLKSMRDDNLLSGEDSGLTNTWDEICVQAQHEESFYWDTYIEVIETLLDAKVDALTPEKSQLLWLATDAGVDWECRDKDETDDDVPPVWDQEIVEYLKSELISRACDNENEDITRYLYRCYGSDEDYDCDDDEDIENEDDEIDEEDLEEETVTPDASDYIRAWKELMVEPYPWVLFENGTCVLLTKPEPEMIL
jgi:hypothetical protein